MAQLGAVPSVSDSQELSASGHTATAAAPDADDWTAVDVNELVDRLRLFVVRRRVRALEFMRDYDRLRSGLIPKSKFISAVMMVGFGLRPAEQEALARAYAAAESGPDSERILYLRFCDDLESGLSFHLCVLCSQQSESHVCAVFVAISVKGLDKAPSMVTRSLDAREAPPLGAAHSELAMTTVRKLRDLVTVRR
jgi:hypothetical protein